MKSKPVHFIITGGTIDSYYEITRDTAVPNKVSVIPDYLKLLRLENKPTIEVVCMKDSRGISTADRKKIVAAIKKSPAKHILVTHGTYTMPDSGRFIEKNLGKTDKVIILTGSMIPLIGFSPSDAGFNLGFAMAKFDTLTPGVYVAMNGRIFTPNEVVKLVSEGRFSSILNT